MESKTTQLKDFFNNFSRKFYSKRIGNFVTLFLTICLTLAVSASGWAQTAYVFTDKADYTPGETVQITGSGFLPGETVMFSIKEIPSDNESIEFSAVADSEGKILMNQFITLQSHLGKAFFINAIGNASLETAQSHFTDAIFTSVDDGNWNSPATWGKTGTPVEGVNYPGPIDNVTITKNNAISLTANASCLTLNISASNTGNGNSSLNMSGFNLTVGSWLNLTSSLNSRTVSLITNGGTLSLAQLNLTTGSSGNTGITTFNLSTNSTLNVSDLISSSGTGNSFIIGNPSTVNYSGTGNQNIFNGFAYNNLILSGGGIKSIVTGTSVEDNLSIAPTDSATASVAAGQTIIVGSLKLGGLGTINETWGSSSSTANYKNNTYFAATTGKVDAGSDTRQTPTVTPTIGSYVYNNNQNGPTVATNTGTGTSYTFSYAGVGLTSYGPSATRPINAGTYTVTATVAASIDGFYKQASSAALAFSINKATASVVVDLGQTKVYGSSDPTFTGVLTGFMPADAVTASYARVSGETVGDYEISATLSPVGVLANYDITNTPADFAITQKTASVTPTPIDKYCGQTDPPLSGVLTGFIPVDNVVAAYSRTTGEIAHGNYIISAVLNPNAVLGNYYITYNTASFIINSISIDASASSTPVQIGSTAILSATVTPNVAGVLVTFYLDDVEIGTDLTDNIGIASLPVSDLAVDVYQVKAVAGGGCSESIVYLPVYDPNGGFVTGGGWFYSLPGSMPSNPTTEGKANFGFNAKYKTGKNNTNEVDGNTEFQFKAGNFNFKSSSNEAMSLVISGAKATYRGVGTVNGTGTHKFMVTAIDGEISGGGGSDKFRIKVWAHNSSSDVIYDNEYGVAENEDASTVIGGGSIVIHKPKSKTTTSVKVSKLDDAELEPLLFNVSAYPNPSADYFTLKLQGMLSEEMQKVEVNVFDLLGRQVYTKQGSAQDSYEFGQQFQVGVYLVTVKQGNNTASLKVIKK